MEELVIPEEGFDAVDLYYDKKLIGQPYQFPENEEPPLKKDFVPGFDIPDPNKKEQEQKQINGVNASLFDFDILEDNLMENNKNQKQKIFYIYNHRYHQIENFLQILLLK